MKTPPHYPQIFSKQLFRLTKYIPSITKGLLLFSILVVAFVSGAVAVNGIVTLLYQVAN